MLHSVSSKGLPQQSASVAAKNVLVADDDEMLLAAISQGLRNRGHKVTAVQDGSWAYQKTRIHQYDVIVLDVKMPRMDGMEATKAIRERAPQACIILISGDAESGATGEAGALGANTFLAKPFRLAELFSVIEHISEERVRKLPTE